MVQMLLMNFGSFFAEIRVQFVCAIANIFQTLTILDSNNNNNRVCHLHVM